MIPKRKNNTFCRIHKNVFIILLLKLKNKYQIFRNIIQSSP